MMGNLTKLLNILFLCLSACGGSQRDILKLENREKPTEEMRADIGQLTFGSAEKLEECHQGELSNAEDLKYGIQFSFKNKLIYIKISSQDSDVEETRQFKFLLNETETQMKKIKITDQKNINVFYENISVDKANICFLIATKNHPYIDEKKYCMAIHEFNYANKNDVITIQSVDVKYLKSPLEDSSIKLSSAPSEKISVTKKLCQAN